MNNNASYEQRTAAPTYSERRIGRTDRRTLKSSPPLLREPGNATVDSTESSRVGRQARARPPLSDDRSWGVQEVAYFLNVSESTIRNLERDGELPALPRIGTRIMFDPKVIRAFRDGWRPPARGRALGRPGVPTRPDPRVQR